MGNLTHGELYCPRYNLPDGEPTRMVLAHPQGTACQGRKGRPCLLVELTCPAKLADQGLGARGVPFYLHTFLMRVDSFIRHTKKGGSCHVETRSTLCPLLPHHPGEHRLQDYRKLGQVQGDAFSSSATGRFVEYDRLLYAYQSMRTVLGEEIPRNRRHICSRSWWSPSGGRKSHA
jgi:hypothetical protein